MPLDGAMVATPPAGTTAVPNTVVASAPYNALKDDIYNIFNTKVQPLAGGGSGSATAIGAFDAFNTKGADIATATTVNLDTATGAFDDLTGTTTVTAVTLAAGKHRMTRAAGDFQITVGASLIGNAGGANVNVKAGDLIIWEGYAAGVVRFWAIPVSGVPLVGTAPPQGYLFGLTLSNNATDAVNDIDIAVGEAASDTSPYVTISLASILTKRLDAAWAVGTGNGGLDTGAIASATYHIWLIRRPDTGVVDALFSLSATAPTMPTNYTQKRRIGAITRPGATIKAFVQYGDFFQYLQQIGDVNAVNPGNSAVTRALTVPTGIRVMARVNLRLTSAEYVSLTDLATTDYLPSATSGTLASLAGGAALNGTLDVLTNTSGQIRSRLNSGAATTLLIDTVGWTDQRGRV